LHSGNEQSALNDPSGILLIDKPEGPTSRRVAETVGGLLVPAPRRRRRDVRRFRVGHAGTLDPMATGLLVVLIGRGTRLAPFLQGLDKRYLATVRLGTATDTHDRQGNVTSSRDVPSDSDGLEEALAALCGEIMQVPPVISSIKRGGRSLHRLARSGHDVPEPEARIVKIKRLKLMAVRWGVPPSGVESSGHGATDGLVYEVDLDITCGSGTYVRSLARDLGTALGTVGHVQVLRRLEVGPFDVLQAVTLDDMHREADPSVFLHPLAAALPHLPGFDLDLAQAESVRHGMQPAVDWLAEPVPACFRLLDPLGHLVAIGRRDPSSGRAVTVAVFPKES
jgi:tRNA pseudouridine55 synthase